MEQPFISHQHDCRIFVLLCFTEVSGANKQSSRVGKSSAAFFKKAPCAIHYGHVLNGDSSKPLNRPSVHTYRVDQWAALVVPRETVGGISAAFFGSLLWYSAGDSLSVPFVFLPISCLFFLKKNSQSITSKIKRCTSQWAREHKVRRLVVETKEVSCRQCFCCCHVWLLESYTVFIDLLAWLLFRQFLPNVPATHKHLAQCAPPLMRDVHRWSMNWVFSG